MAIVVGYRAAATRSSNIPTPIQINPQFTHQASPQKTTITVRAVGDVMLGREVNVKSQTYKNYNWPFEQTIPHLPPTDIFIGNLEAPLYQGCPSRSDGMIFCAPPEAVSGLVYAKFTHLSLANNHSLNYGQDGHTQTTNLLIENHITPISNYQPIITTIKNIRFGLIAVDDISTIIDQERVVNIISDLKSKTSVVMVIPHWGHEYWSNPSPRQEKLAKIFIDSGANIILGAHPHVIQPIIQQDNNLIAYSLGNFVFDQMWSPETRASQILDLDLTFTASQLTHIAYQQYLATIHDYGQPRLDINQPHTLSGIKD